MQHKILIAEDDTDISRLLSRILEAQGYQALQAFSGTEALSLIEREEPDLLLLDLMLPGLSGEELLRKLREERRYSIPVLILSAKSALGDKVALLKSGADDYITKPFSISILKLRLEKALKNHTSESDTNKNPANTQLCSGTVRLNVKTARAFLNETELELSLTEFRLLRYFLENKNQVLLKEQILQHIWDHDSNFVEENTLSVNISRLRRKIGNNHIKTIYGMGYLWEET